MGAQRFPMLRAVGAVIDFDQDVGMSKNINPKKAIKLERATSGHLLIDLTNMMGSVARPGEAKGIHDEHDMLRVCNVKPSGFMVRNMLV